ncbi:MAG: iron chelate uptake ABC transporter family permease subunit [Promicromonosporaceae bacterium]|nr:iron chelate uptake ABC transporter family permease subunit [Promicromonosporaceae bacterium]
MRSRPSLCLLVVATALVASVLVTVTIGPAELSVADVWRTIAAQLGLGEQPDAITTAMVWQLRLPRVLTAGAVGAGLALAGAVMQTLTRNALADPFLLGLSGGASLGAVSVMVLGLSVAGVAVAQPLAAFGGAVLALTATLALAGASGRGTLSPSRTVLAGLAVGQAAAAGTSFIIFWSVRGDQAREVLAWLMGSLAGSSWTAAGITLGAVTVVGGGVILLGNLLDAFAFGDEAAAALGINVPALRASLLVAVALLTGALVSQSGSIGFVGLLIPHAVRLLIGAGHRVVLGLSALTGATFLIWADTLARTVFAPRELPVGILTAAIGAPVFAAILLRGRAEA